MPTDEAHLSKYHIAKAAQLALQADSNRHPDWIVITAFYQALHWVDAFLATKQRHPSDHRERNWEVRNNADLKIIKRNYNRLYKAGRFARYDAQTYKNRPNEVKSLETDLKSIISHISQLI